MDSRHLGLLLLPPIAAAIGWFTNWVAIQMLFRPRQPIRLLGLWTWQGLIPHRRADLTAKVAAIVEREILDHHFISEEIRRLDLAPHLQSTARHLVRNRLEPRLRAIPLLGKFLSPDLLTRLETILADELAREAPPILTRVAADFESRFQVRAIISARLDAIDLDRLEAIVLEVSRREFRTIEHLGGLLGFLVGLTQLALLWFLG